MSSSRLASHRQLSSSSIASENLPPATLQRIARKLRDLHKAPPQGVQLVEDSDVVTIAGHSATQSNSLSELVVELEGPAETPYAGKFFLVKMSFGSDFPSTPPRGFFLTKIYHPNVDESTGAICVNTLKKDWTPDTSLQHVLSVIRCLLIVPFPESSLNDQAGKLFMESYEEYAQRAKLLANVHGRSESLKPRQKTDESSPIDGSGKNEKGSVEGKPRILQSTADNRSKKKKMIKKKSLKRL